VAIDANSVFEVRTTGSNTNGGFYKSDAGTTDYSQQDAAQFTATDAVTNGTTTVNFPTGTTPTLDSSCVGNGIFLSNTGSWYEIVSFTDVNNVVVDRTVASATGVTANIGGAVALITDALIDGVTVAGNIWWVKSGTYTSTGNVVLSKSGTANALIKIIGYQTTRGDTPTGDNRPLFALGTNIFRINDWTEWSLFRATYSGTGASAIEMDQQSTISEAKVEFTTSGALTIGLEVGNNGGSLIKTEVSAPNASAVSTALVYGLGSSIPTMVIDNYVHDCAGLGIRVNAIGVIQGNIVDTCTGGIFGINSPIIKNNTIYNCSGNGIEITGSGARVMYNDFNSCGVALEGNASNAVRNDYNNYYNNTTDEGTNITKGANATAIDPSYADAANGDFTNQLEAIDYISPFSLEIRAGAQQSSGAAEISYGFSS
jgi:hypothetical protein